MASKRDVMARLTAEHAASARARFERERANLGDVAEFLTQRSREWQVQEWFDASVERLEQDAAKRRARFRSAAGAALQAMIDRGASVKDVAEAVNIPAVRVTEYLSEARAAVKVAPPVNGAVVAPRRDEAAAALGERGVDVDGG